MRVALAFGSFVLAGSVIVTGIWGAVVPDAHMFMAAVILALAFFVIGFHAADKDSKEHRK